jgi:uncharacterized iron-regulated protein
MRNQILSIAAGILVTATSWAQKPAYQLFSKSGKKTTYDKMVADAAKVEVVLFGEHHNNPICHWLQLELTQDVAAKKPVVLGAEMIEADNQKQLDDYLAGRISQKQFDTLARLWSNHKTDYKPLVDFAKDKKLKFVAANIPRRYASMVSKKGMESLDALTDEEKSWMMPLPMPYDANLPGYVNMMKMMGDHANENFPKAQAVKDATMAHFIIKNMRSGSVFIHYNGTYHSDNYEGIGWYLQKYRPGTKVLTIATVDQDSLDKLEAEHLNKADYILVVDGDMTKTY